MPDVGVVSRVSKVQADVIVDSKQVLTFGVEWMKVTFVNPEVCVFATVTGPIKCGRTRPVMPLKLLLPDVMFTGFPV